MPIRLDNYGPLPLIGQAELAFCGWLRLGLLYGSYYGGLDWPGRPERVVNRPAGSKLIKKYINSDRLGERVMGVMGVLL